MNRIVWIARIVALLMLLVFAIIMMNLHSKLTTIQATQPKVSAPR